MNRNNWTTIQSSIPSELHRQFKIKLIQDDLSISDFVRNCIVNYVGRENISEEILQDLEGEGVHAPLRDR